MIGVLNKKGEGGFAGTDLQLIEEAADNIQDLVDSVFLGRKVYGATDEFVEASRWTILAVLGLTLPGSAFTLSLVAAWTAMPIVGVAVSPALAPLLSGQQR